MATMSHKLLPDDSEQQSEEAQGETAARSALLNWNVIT